MHILATQMTSWAGRHFSKVPAEIFFKEELYWRDLLLYAGCQGGILEASARKITSHINMEIKWTELKDKIDKIIR